MNSNYLVINSCPGGTESLVDIALDLRWTWNHSTDKLWNMIDPVLWQLTQNPWLILQTVSSERISLLLEDAGFKNELERLVGLRQEYSKQLGWFRETYQSALQHPVVYFSMEFGLGEGIPLYAGGLGILAGDYLKTASDLNIPVVGIGLLYQEGYSRQMIDNNGWQISVFPYNDPHILPIQPARDASGAWLHVTLELPGRTLSLQVWQARVGRVMLYLLDSNSPLNTPYDRGITSRLYEDNREIRLLQEMVLGICGWKVIEALDLQPEVCHLNEGHAAFMVLERARRFMYEHDQSFDIALWATRSGNVFTTHTPVAAGFDEFSPDMVIRYFYNYLVSLKISSNELLALGRQDHTSNEPFNMAVLALHGCTSVNGVSLLHGITSRRLFQGLYPRWTENEVPVGHITNGVHTHSWDSPLADKLWTRAGRGTNGQNVPGDIATAIGNISDEDLWDFRNDQRKSLVSYVQDRLSYQIKQSEVEPAAILRKQNILNPDALTLGFARRFTTYKRPNLLLQQADRLSRILTNTDHPVQIIVAGKAHPDDDEGKRLIQEFIRFAKQPIVAGNVVFLEDYDLGLAQQLVQGVDLWINTPRRPLEACGTSGMKVLVNGGLNLSELDGWWAEAFSLDAGWALGDGKEHAETEWDKKEASQLYDLLEYKIIPEFYSRNERNVPIDWIKKVRYSMENLTPRFDSKRMLREYVEKIYLPASERYLKRTRNDASIAKELHDWHTTLEQQWPKIHFGNRIIKKENEFWDFEIQVYLGDIDPSFVEVQIYAEQVDEEDGICKTMTRIEKLPGDSNGFTYRGNISTKRPVDYLTVRVVPAHKDALIPMEDNHIVWQR
jgi:glycogen phosphorylase